jgi:hypothetical protein
MERPQHLLLSVQPKKYTPEIELTIFIDLLISSYAKTGFIEFEG